MSASTARGRRGGPVRRPPSRTRFPDLSPQAAFSRVRTPAPPPLFLTVGRDSYSVRDLGREPGDEANRVLELKHPDGRVFHAAECPEGHECDCPEFRRDEAFDCPHLRALTREGIFPPIRYRPDELVSPGPDLGGNDAL